MSFSDMVNEQGYENSHEDTQSLAGYCAYIRPMSVEGKQAFAIISDEGVQLAVFDSYDTAYFSARQYDLTLVPLH